MKKIANFLLILAILIALVRPVGVYAAYDSALESLEPLSTAIYLVCLDNGTVVFEKNADEQRMPASLVKLVTAIITLEECSDLSKVVTVKDYTIRMFDGLNSSNAGTKPGENLTVEQLLYCLLVKSANESAAILADYVCENEDTPIPAFVDKMNAFAERLGCKNTHFVNPHGLDEAGGYSSARDIATIIQYALSFEKKDIFETIVSTTKYTLPATNKNPERNLFTTNFLMNSGYADYYCKYVSGIKTGTTSGAGRCVAAKASKDGYTYLAVIMGGPFEDVDNDGVEENGAFLDAKKLLEWCFSNMKLKEVVEENKIITDLPVELAWKVDHVRLVPENKLTLLVPSGVDSGSVLVEADESTLPDKLMAPVKAGDKVGEAVVLYAGEEIGRVGLITAEDIERSGLLYIGYVLGRLVRTMAFRVIAIAVVLLAVLYIMVVLYFNSKKKKRRKLRVLNGRDVLGNGRNGRGDKR